MEDQRDNRGKATGGQYERADMNIMNRDTNIDDPFF